MLLHRLILCASLLFSSAILTIACLNLYSVDEHGREHEIYGLSQIPTGPAHPYTRFHKKELKVISKKIQETSDTGLIHEYVSDYCVYLIRLGRADLALPIQRRLLEIKPNEYNFLANIAVSFELLGKNDSALTALDKALEINPDAHLGSEWFHRAYLLNNPEDGLVLKLEERFEEDSTPYYSIFNEISHQLHERLPLSSAPNEKLSKVLFECADFYKSHLSIEYAIMLYNMGAGYSNDFKVHLDANDEIEKLRKRMIELKIGESATTPESEVLLQDDWQKVLRKKRNECSNYRAYYFKGAKARTWEELKISKT